MTGVSGAGTPHRVTLIPGDGVGPELVACARRVLEATGVAFEWEIQEAGEAALAHEGTPLPERVLASLRSTRIGLKGPITTPVGTGFRSVNVALRRELDLFACVRPCKIYRGVRTRFAGADLVVIRENTEDLYAGVELEAESPGARALLALVEKETGRRLRPDSALSLKPISRAASRRIARYAFEYARRHRRRKVTAAHKANIMKHTDGLFLEAAREVAAGYPEVAFEDRIVDNLSMQLVQRPEDYDVLLAPNLYGDILSDLAAGLVGGLGVAPGANLGDEVAVFEATHGSAPTFRGRNRLDPAALILSGALLLRHLREERAAERVEAAVARIIAEGRRVTFDLKRDPDDPTAVGSTEMTDAIVEALSQA